MAESEYAAALAGLIGVRQRLEEGRLAPGEVETLIAQAKQALESGRAALRRADATIEVLDISR